MENILRAIAERIAGGKKTPVQPKKAKILPQATRPVNPALLSEDQISKGFTSFNPKTPLATQSAVMKQAMNIMAANPKVDPFLAIGVALRESRGGLDLEGREQGVNNVYNVMPGGELTDYPDLKTAVLGGPNPKYNTESKGFVNLIMKSPAYAKYRETGNVDDFNAVYSPPNSGNPTLQKQREDLEKLKKLFYR